MDLGEKLRAAWKFAASEAGGIEHLTELFSRLALLFSGCWVLALVFLDWVRSPFFAGVFLTALMLGGFALGIVNIALSLQAWVPARRLRSEEHTSELQSHHDLVCRLLLEKKKKKK